MSGASSPFKGETDDEAAGAQLIKSCTERSVILNEDIPQAEFSFHLYGEFEKGQEEVRARTEVQAGIAFGELEDVSVLQALVDIRLGLHVPTQFSAKQRIGGEVSNPVRAELDEQGEVEVHAFRPHVDGFDGTVWGAEAIEHAAILKAQSGNETDSDRVVDIQRCEQGEVESRKRIVFYAQQAVRKRKVWPQVEVETA